MKIAIVGGGFTGLACGLYLSEQKVGVTLFEKNKLLGGLAGGVKRVAWKWSLEYFYHHIFTNDKDILSLAKNVGAEMPEYSPQTTSLFEKNEVQLDSPISVLKFSGLSFWDRLRMGFGLFLLKIIHNGMFLEKYKVIEVLPKLIGKQGYRKIWESLLKAKFGKYYCEVNMTWFWARIVKRSKNLCYPDGGFQNLVEKTGEKIIKNGGQILLGKNITKIQKNKNGKWLIDGQEFDKVVVTVPAPLAEKMLDEKLIFPKISYLWGQTLILELSEKLIKGYWMNILEDNWPFLVVVEQTNMIDKKYYGNRRVVYLGNYLTEDNKQLKMNKEELIKKYLPYLRKINKSFRKKWIKNAFLFRQPYAQPVFSVNYSKNIPEMKTNMPGLYLANMSMVYPFDRGTNYAVKMGVDVAKKLLADIR